MNDQSAAAPVAPAKGPQRAQRASASYWLATGLRGSGHRPMPAGDKAGLYELPAQAGCEEIETPCPLTGLDHLLAIRIGQVMAKHGLDLPSGLRAEFARILLAGAASATEQIPADQLSDAFGREYMVREPGSALLLRCTVGRPRLSPADPWITLFDIRQSMCVTEANPALVVAATMTALGFDVTILSRHYHQLEPGGLFIVYAECLAGCRAWGAGIGGDLTSALLKAVLSSVCRAGLMRAPRQ